ncbi:carbohydrate ABC transporter permease [Bacillus sp. FJAT-50079]|uniref:carbohydrate ABC transporter permease n=1 Tax=Bacillus sp. FJAT-50079 TaxID=2833577 RepID=UPI001BC9F385|nr:carbohydrate ABC transporter permease [Bacillus sp. FJAT-50079]MBS4208674.1 carbohydrate ABC transporter permease [Bacillus sp. FJAT-50079]
MIALKRKKVKVSLTEYVLAAFLLLLGLFMLYPLWWVLMTSLADPVWLSTNTVVLWPGKFGIDAYRFILSEGKLWTSYLNSAIYALGSTVVTLIVCSLYAYPFTLPKFKGKLFFNLLLIIPMFFSGGMIPTYMQIANLGMLDTVWSMMLPGAISAYYVILIRTYMKGIPMELRESAIIDGASDFKIYWLIVLPLSKVILLIIALFSIVDSWNSFTPPLLYLSDDAKMPLSIYLRNLLITNTMDTSELTMGTSYYQAIASAGGGIGMRIAMKMGTIIVSILPIMLIYPLIQKHFVKGVMLGSVKG